MLIGGSKLCLYHSAGPVRFRLGQNTSIRASHSPDKIALRLFQHEAPAVAKECRAQADKLQEAYVRVRVGAEAHALGVEILEPAASAGLKRCLDKALRAIAVPPGSLPATIVLPVPLANS